jgi:hypothetical protein
MDRRKENVFWKIVERSTNLVFLLLAIVILSKTWQDEKSSSELQAEKKALVELIDNRTYYLEGKINRQAEIQDDYQISVSRRLDIVDNRLKVLEQENKALKQQQKNVITQTNTQIVNGERKR